VTPSPNERVAQCAQELCDHLLALCDAQSAVIDDRIRPADPAWDVLHHALVTVMVDRAALIAALSRLDHPAQQPTPTERPPA
jgi:hypothetical protein